MTNSNIEIFQDFEIEWIFIPSFELNKVHHTHGLGFYYKKDKMEILVGFIEGYEWYHTKKGLCKIYILSQDSNEWSDLISESRQIIREVKESSYEILKNRLVSGRVKGNINILANA